MDILSVQKDMRKLIVDYGLKYNNSEIPHFEHPRNPYPSVQLGETDEWKHKLTINIQNRHQRH